MREQEEQQYKITTFNGEAEQVTEAIEKARHSMPLFPPSYKPQDASDGGYNLTCKGDLMRDESQEPLHFADVDRAAAYARLHQAGLLQRLEVHIEPSHRRVQWSCPLVGEVKTDAYPVER